MAANSFRVTDLLVVVLGVGLLGSAPSCGVENIVHVENRTGTVLEITTDEVLDNLDEPLDIGHGRSLYRGLNPGAETILATRFPDDCIDYRIVAWRSLRNEDGEFLGREVIEILEAGEYCVGDVWIIDGDPAPAP